MGILIFIILAIGIIIFLHKKFNVGKKAIRAITVISILIGITLMLIDKTNVIDKIKNEIYINQPTITEEGKQQAIATIQYAMIMGIDAQTYENCYIYKSADNSYYYFITSSRITIAGSQGEKINKKGNVNSKNQLERIVNDFEKKIKSKTSTMEYVTINYDGKKVEKEEFLSKMFK